MNSQLNVSISIIISGLIIAGAIIYTGSADGTGRIGGDSETDQNEQEEVLAEPRAVSSDDYIKGSLGADIIIVEYSDTECPYCKQFHGTMNQVVETYGDRVAWVYRHFPIPSLHRKATEEARATECVAELGGNDAFWIFTDMIYEQTPSNDGLDFALLPEFAAEAGVSRSDFAACMADSTRHQDKVKADRDDAIASGARGTPHSVMYIGDRQVPINGAEPFEMVADKIEAELTRIDQIAL